MEASGKVTFPEWECFRDISVCSSIRHDVASTCYGWTWRLAPKQLAGHPVKMNLFVFATVHVQLSCHCMRLSGSGPPCF
jgi:hypothetical protein